MTQPSQKPNPAASRRVTYRGVGLAAFTPNANIVRRTRSQRVPTVTARNASRKPSQAV